MAQVLYNSGGLRLVKLELAPDGEKGGLATLLNSAGEIVVTGVRITPLNPAPGEATPVAGFNSEPADPAPVLKAVEPGSTDSTTIESEEKKVEKIEDPFDHFSFALENGETVSAAELVENLTAKQLHELAELYDIEVDPKAAKPVIAAAILGSEKESESSPKSSATSEAVTETPAQETAPAADGEAETEDAKASEESSATPEDSEA